MSPTKKLVRRIWVALIGFPLVIVGIILLPLPGPGFVVILLGLFILAREFDWAKRYADLIKRKSAQLVQKAKSKTK